MSVSPGSELSRLRWNRPDVVEYRVDRLAETIRAHVAKLPPLTDEQRAKLLTSLGGGR